MLNAEKILSLALAHDLETIITEARRDIALEAAKERGGATMAQRTKKALAYIKACTARPEQAGASIIEYHSGTYQSFTNGYTGFLLKNHLPGLPEAQTPFDLARCLSTGGEPVEDLPAQLSEARRVIAEYNATYKSLMTAYRADMRAYKNAPKDNKPPVPRKPTQPPIVIGKCGYNPQYLLDVCAILGGDITMYQDDNKPLSPARLESENGIAILLPVRLAQ